MQKSKKDEGMKICHCHLQHISNLKYWKKYRKRNGEASARYFFVFLSFFGYLLLKKDKQIKEKGKQRRVWCGTPGV